MSDDKIIEKNFVLVKLDSRYENIKSRAGNFTKTIPSVAPATVDEDTFDYFETLEAANAEAIQRKKDGLPFMENLVVTGKDMMKKKFNKESLVNDSKRKPAKTNGVTTRDTIKPNRQQQQENAKVMNEDGEISDPNYDPSLDLNNDGANDSKDAAIAGRVLALSKKQYKDVKETAKKLGINPNGKKKAVVYDLIAKAEKEAS